MQSPAEKNLFRHIDEHRSSYLQTWHHIQQHHNQAAYITLLKYLQHNPSFVTPTLDLEHEVVFGTTNPSLTTPSLLCYLSFELMNSQAEPNTATLLPFFACQAALDIYKQHAFNPVQVKWILQKQAYYDQTKLKHIVTEQHAFLQHDSCLWYFTQPLEWESYYPATIIPDMLLGTKGLLSTELTAHTTATSLPLHFGAIVPDASWLLTWALGSLKNKQEDILIEGFYDPIETPVEEVLTALANLPDDTQAQLARWQTPGLLPGLYARSKHYAYFLTPTCTITQLSTIQPPISQVDLPSLSNSASARLDFLLVNGQNPYTLFNQLQLHLANEGFTQVHAHNIQAQLPLSTPYHHPFTRQVYSALTQSSRQEPFILPCLPTYIPIGLLEYLHTPTILLPQNPDRADQDDYFISTVKLFVALFASFRSNT